MPTGYTACIEDGVSFKDFVLRCACAMFYDRTELPEKFTVSDFYSKKLIELGNELECIERMDVEEAEIKSQEECDKNNMLEERWVNGRSELKKKYADMLEKIYMWKPPSKDHYGLKEFIIQQLKSSIDFDCKDYPRTYYEKVSGENWIASKKTRLLKDIQYYTEEDCKERKRVADSNLWVEQLRNSLKDME